MLWFVSGEQRADQAEANNWSVDIDKSLLFFFNDQFQ